MVNNLVVEAKAVTGIGQTIAGAFTHPIISFRTQPGRFVGSRKDPNRKFIPNPRFPDGVYWSFPAWFVAIAGMAVLVRAMGGMEKILEGLEATDKEKKAMEDLTWESMLAGITPLGWLASQFVGE